MRRREQRDKKKKIMKESFSIFEKVTTAQRHAGYDAARIESEGQRKAGGEVDKATVDQTARRAASRATPESRPEPQGFRKMSKAEYKKARSKLRRTNIVRAKPPSIQSLSHTKPGSESRAEQAAIRKRHQDATTPQRRLPK